MLRSISISVSLLLLIAMSADRCFARPLYRAVLEKEFKKFGVINCTACHDGEDKRQRNDYAKKLEAALGERNVRDEARIVAAVKKIGVPPAPPAKPAAAPPIAEAAARAAAVMDAAAARPAQARPAIRIVAPAVVVQQAVEVDDAGNEVAVPIQRFSITHQNLDQWIFGANKTIAQARTEFESQLKNRLEALATKYELDANQKRKLQLAGRGDIKRFLSEAETLHMELGDASANTVVTLDQQAYNQIHQRAMALRNRYITNNRVVNGTVVNGLFDDYSLLSKTIPKTIGPKFVDQYLLELTRQRTEQYEGYLTQSVQNLANFLMLREDQKDKFKGFLRGEIVPPPRFNQYVYTYVMYHLAKMPDDKLGQVLDEAQIARLGVIKANTARYEEYLRANGLLSNEDEDGREEDSR